MKVFDVITVSFVFATGSPHYKLSLHQAVGWSLTNFNTGTQLDPLNWVTDVNPTGWSK